MTASALLLAAVTSVAGLGPGFFKPGGDPAPGLLVNVTAGCRPFDAPDPAKPAVVFIHGWNPAGRAFHFTIAQQLSAAIARRGEPPCNVLAWDWNGATVAGLHARDNRGAAVEQGRRLASALMASGLPAGRVQIIGHSLGCIVAASAARNLRDATGGAVARLTLLDPATVYHDYVFDRFTPGAICARVEHYWAPGATGFSREVNQGGVLNFRVDPPHPLRFAHWNVATWYIASADARAGRIGYGAAPPGP
jgi:pimeloyl-ACP methyl ester carboxylesterase